MWLVWRQAVSSDAHISENEENNAYGKDDWTPQTHWFISSENILTTPANLDKLQNWLKLSVTIIFNSHEGI